MTSQPDQGATTAEAARIPILDVEPFLAGKPGAAAALARTESRGCHHRGDFPHADPAQAVSRTLHDLPAAMAPSS